MSIRKRIFLVFLSVILLSLVFAGCIQSGGGTLRSIKQANVLRVGVKSDVPKFGFFNPATGAYEGLEIELAKLIAQDILGNSEKVNFIPVNAKNRGALLDSGEVDMVIAAFTITDERRYAYNFSTPYYTDAVGILTRKSSGIRRLGDLDGRIIGVAQDSTSRAAIETAVDPSTMSLTFAEFAAYPDVKAALSSGRIAGFAVDKSILRSYLDKDTTILPESFAPQSYGIATKLNNRELSFHIENLMIRWLKDGTITRLITKFGL